MHGAALSASSTRAASPPEATSDSGRSCSDGPAASRNSTLSSPLSHGDSSTHVFRTAPSSSAPSAPLAPSTAAAEALAWGAVPTLADASGAVPTLADALEAPPAEEHMAAGEYAGHPLGTHTPCDTSGCERARCTLRVTSKRTLPIARSTSDACATHVTSERWRGWI
eukprot:365569-Chlamydomonas_euryale.AAC.3